MSCHDRFTNTQFLCSPDPKDPDSHKDEGFLKSMWHNLTHHPAHEKDASGASGSTGESTSDDKGKKENKSASD